MSKKKETDEEIIREFLKFRKRFLLPENLLDQYKKLSRAEQNEIWKRWVEETLREMAKHKQKSRQWP